jgi:hypothetical protein
LPITPRDDLVLAVHLVDEGEPRDIALAVERRRAIGVEGLAAEAPADLHDVVGRIGGEAQVHAVAVERRLLDLEAGLDELVPGLGVVEPVLLEHVHAHVHRPGVDGERHAPVHQRIA